MLTKPLINFADPFLTYVRIAKLICAEPLIMMPNVMEHLWTLLTLIAGVLGTVKSKEQG